MLLVAMNAIAVWKSAFLKNAFSGYRALEKPPTAHREVDRLRGRRGHSKACAPRRPSV